MRTQIAVSIILTFSLALGCSDAPTTQVGDAGPQASSQANAQATMPGFTPSRPSKVYNDAGAAVNDFLNAATSGDNATATALLTAKAQEELWSNGLEVFNAGLPGSSFQVTATQQVSETETHVETFWEDEFKNRYPCVWLLRKESHGFAIFGMATKFLEHEQAVLLPFEDQKELQRLQAEAERKIKAYQQQMLAQQQQQQAAAQGGSVPNRFGEIQQTSGTTGGQVRQASSDTTFRQ